MTPSNPPSDEDLLFNISYAITHRLDGKARGKTIDPETLARDILAHLRRCGVVFDKPERKPLGPGITNGPG